MAWGEQCFTFIWKLENVSYCCEEKGEAIYSPKFVVDSIDEIKWSLGLYLRGKENEDNIGFYLYREENKNSPKEIEYELEFVDQSGSSLISGDVVEYDFNEAEGCGDSEYIEREELFNGSRYKYLHQDTLIARCRIFETEMKEHILCIARTRIGIQKRSFVWEVKKFSTLELGKTYTTEIESESHGEELMSISLSLTRGSSKLIRFEITHKSQDTRFSTLQLSFVDVSGKKVHCNRDEFWINDSNNKQELILSFTINKLMEMKSFYLPGDILSLHWEWTFSKGIVSNEIEELQYPCINSYEVSDNAQNMKNQRAIALSQSLIDRLKSLYDENFLSDVKLKTSTRTFDAHKFFLCASSPVFKAMFSSDMKENKSNLVNIEDFSDETVSQMLLYMYSARVEDLSWERASHLYAAADKYGILSLKDICSSFIKDNLSPSNACEVLLLSDSHADGDLKSAVQSYILKHMKGIVKSDAWKQLMDTNATLAAETVCLQYD